MWDAPAVALLPRCRWARPSRGIPAVSLAAAVPAAARSRAWPCTGPLRLTPQDISKMTPPIAAGTPHRALLLFSGGLDSVLSWHALQRSGYHVATLTVTYDGRPAGEVNACEHLLDLLCCRRSHRLMLDGWGRVLGPSPQGVPPDIRAGFIPHRNLVLWALAASVAASNGYSTIAAGHTSEDTHHFNDSSPSFFTRLQPLVRLAGATEVDLELLLPLSTLPDEGVSLAKTIPRRHLDRTWSCWMDSQQPCQRCFACKERDEFLQEVRQI